MSGAKSPSKSPPPWHRSSPTQTNGGEMRCSSLRPDPFERPVPAQSGPTAGESRPPVPSRLRKAEYLPGEPACFKVPPRRGQVAFTLLEVMIACGIFFIAVFAILALVSNTLRNAQRLRRIEVDAGM